MERVFAGGPEPETMLGPDAAAGRGRLRGGLIAVQSALAVVLLIGALRTE